MLLQSVESFQGLQLKSPISLTSSTTAVIGRNGSGKTRLLKAISEGKVTVSLNGNEIPRDRIKHLSMEQLQPGFVTGFDPLAHRTEVQQAQALYLANKGKFDPNPSVSIKRFSGTPARGLGRSGRVSLELVARIASIASAAVKKCK
jgi:ABC-type branched-subunit amino acid transport system ATPase component